MWVRELRMEGSMQSHPKIAKNAILGWAPAFKSFYGAEVDAAANERVCEV